MNYDDFIRERITRLRLERNLSEYQLSYELGQSKGYIQSITSGRARLPWRCFWTSATILI